MRLALPLYFALYIGVAFVLRSWLVWWRTGVNPVVIGTADDVSGYIGRLMRLTIGAIAVVVTVYALAPTVYERLGPFVLLERPAAQASGGLLLAASFLWTVLAQRQMGVSWRIGVDQARRTDLVAGGLFSVSRNPILSFAKISSHSVDEGPCSRDRPRHARGLLDSGSEVGTANRFWAATWGPRRKERSPR